MNVGTSQKVQDYRLVSRQAVVVKVDRIPAFICVQRNLNTHLYVHCDRCSRT